MGLLPQGRRLAVETEEARQSAIALISTGGAVLLGVLGERIQQAPAGRLGELFMLRCFELSEDRQNVRGVNGPGFRCLHDSDTGSIFSNVQTLQILGHSFKRQKLRFEFFDRFEDKAVQFNP